MQSEMSMEHRHIHVQGTLSILKKTPSVDRSTIKPQVLAQGRALLNQLVLKLHKVAPQPRGVHLVAWRLWLWEKPNSSLEA